MASISTLSLSAVAKLPPPGQSAGLATVTPSASMCGTRPSRTCRCVTVTWRPSALDACAFTKGISQSQRNTARNTAMASTIPPRTNGQRRRRFVSLMSPPTMRGLPGFRVGGLPDAARPVILRKTGQNVENPDDP